MASTVPVDSIPSQRNRQVSRLSWLFTPVVAIGVIAVVLAVVFGTSAIVSAPSGAGFSAGYGDGATVYATYCSACHNTASVPGGAIGPDLSEIGATAASRREGMSATAYLFESIVDPEAYIAPGAQAQMPSGFSSILNIDQIRGIVAFLARQGGTVNGDEIEALTLSPDQTQPTSTERFVRRENDVRRGKELFFGAASCDRCHSVLPGEDAFRLLGPGLWGVGSQSTSQLRESILDPSATVDARFVPVRVTLANGSTVSGTLLSSTQSEVIIATEAEDGTGELVRLDAASILNRDGMPAIETLSISTMPADYARSLDDSAVTALVAFLKTLE